MAATADGPVVSSTCDAQQRLDTYSLLYKVTDLSSTANAAKIDEAQTATGIPDFWEIVPGLQRTWVVGKSVRMTGSNSADVAVTALKPFFKPFIEYGTTMVQELTDIDAKGEPMTVSHTDANSNSITQAVRVPKWIPQPVARVRIYREEHPKTLRDVCGKTWKGTVLINGPGDRTKYFPWLVWSLQATEFIYRRVWDVTIEFLHAPKPPDGVPWHTSHYLANPDGTVMLDAAGEPVARLFAPSVYEYITSRVLDFVS